MKLKTVVLQQYLWKQGVVSVFNVTNLKKNSFSNEKDSYQTDGQTRVWNPPYMETCWHKKFCVPTLMAHKTQS